MAEELPLGLQTVVEKLNFWFQVFKTGQFETFQVDLSDWNLSLTATNPAIWVRKTALSSLAASELATRLLDVARQLDWFYDTILVFVDGDTQELRAHLPSAMPRWVLINQDQQNRIQRAASKNEITSEMLEILLAQMERRQLAPYETDSPVTGSQFFGRRAEISQILHRSNSYLIVGIRQIGKTSLLKEIERRLNRIDPTSKNQIRRIYVDCSVMKSAEDFLGEVTLRLLPSEYKMLMGRAAQRKFFLSRMYERFADEHGGPITFLIDEVDCLLDQITDQDALFGSWREAATSKKARFIIAGFRSALDTYENVDSPFYNFTTQMDLGSLLLDEVQQMIVSPMAQLHISIQNQHRFIERIYRETAGLPNYIQWYCHLLLKKMDEENRRMLGEEDVQDIYRDRTLRDFVVKTFMRNTQPLEKALVYALVAEADPHKPNSFTRRMMDASLKKRKLTVRGDTVFEMLCRNLEVAKILKRTDKGANFEFAVPLLPIILRETFDVEFNFEKVREELLATYNTQISTN